MSEEQPYTFPEAMPHGALEEVFDGVFFVTGTTRPNFQGMKWQFSRNMTVIREGNALTIVNSVRLDEEGLAALDALGEVKHVVQIGGFHGFDDPFYIDRYGATLWSLPGKAHEGGLTTDRELVVGGEMPVEGLSLFVFESAKHPEALLLLERDGGVLISCDACQNWEKADAYFDEPSAERMGMFGFFRKANLGPGWRRASEPTPEDVARIRDLEFRHLLSAHGTPLRDEAKEALSATIKELMGV